MLETITPASVAWTPDAPPRGVRCTVCGGLGPHRSLLDVPAMSPPHPTLTLLRCAQCQSGFFDPPGITDFSDLNQVRDDFWRFYVEAGGGIWETIWPLLAVPAHGQRSRSLLDVGCGFGFAVDFWQRSGSGSAVGVELANYGKIGAERLGITVHAEMLQDCRALAGRRFDVVYASEVVEHVPDPAAFVALLADRVADGGVLVLTTPTIEYVKPANLSMTLLAAMSPGFHGFLLSAQKFGDLARAAGFPHVEVRTFGERQMLWASHAPLTLDLDDARMRGPYFDYMETRTAHRDPGSPVWQGYAYRLVRDYVNAGRFRDAQPLLAALAAAVEAEYGPHVSDPVAVLERIAACESVIDYASVGPYFLPQLYYQRAAIAQHVKGDASTALGLYRATADTAIALARLSAMSFLEAYALVWPARVQEAALRLAQGDAESAAQAFAALAREGLDCRAENGYGVVSAEYVDATVPRACETLFLQDKPELARLVFEAYCDSLARRAPGADWTVASNVADALAGRAIDGAPADPVFPLFFAGLLDLGPRGTGSAERLRSLQALASSASPRDAVHRDRLAHYAAIAARYLPAPLRTPVFEASYTLTPTVSR